MLKVTIIFFLLTSLYAEQKNSDYSIIVDKDFNDALYSVVEDYDRAISAVGFSTTFHGKNSSYANSYSNAFDYLESLSHNYMTKIYLLKVDKYGTLHFSHTQNLPQFSKAQSLLKTPSNGYFIGGTTQDGSLLLLKLDANVNILFTKKFGTNNHNSLSKLVALQNGGVLAVGSSMTTRFKYDALYETGLGKNDIYITKFSKDGKKIWSKKYGTPYDDVGMDAVEAQDASIIIVGKTINENNQTISLMRINENGEKIWKRDFTSQKENAPYKLLRLRNGKFILSMTQYNEMQKEQIRVIKFDLYSNILIDKTISTAYASALNDIKEFSDGVIAGVGYTKDSFDTDGLLMLLDTDLNMLSQEHYGGKNYDTFTALSILHNSQIAAVGINTSDTSQESNMWLVKLNRDGTFAKKAIHKKDIHHAFYKAFQDNINKKQIKLTDDLNLEFTKKALYFQAGKYKLTDKQKQFLDNFSKKLVSFLKKNQDQIRSIEINGHSSSEWRGVSFEKNYLNNQKLSMQRSFRVLSYIFSKQDKKTQKMLAKLLRGSGFSYSKNSFVHTKESKHLSRRVSFRILLKKSTLHQK